jgi:hypothetical protein
MRTYNRFESPPPASTEGGSAEVRGCEWKGCESQGLYRAPRSPRALNRYRWFCLEHVREYNAAWNYYAGMTDAEVEADIRSDTVWQRPTWRLGAAIPVYAWRAAQHIHDGFATYNGHDQRQQREQHREPQTAEERALIILQLHPPVTVAIVKARYKELVKQHHPDANGGDKASEERFKEISDAYRTVMKSLT